ncbi:MAG: hypothetical protein ACKN9S_10735, partial [Pirellula sp.]
MEQIRERHSPILVLFPIHSELIQFAIGSDAQSSIIKSKASDPLYVGGEWLFGCLVWVLTGKAHSSCFDDRYLHWDVGRCFCQVWFIVTTNDLA